MKFTIITEDNNFGVDGVFREIDLSSLVGTVKAVQFDTDNNIGEIEMGVENQVITSFDPFQKYYNDWVAAEPLPPPPLTYKEHRSSEYPSYYDYLDGIVKNDQAQIDKYIADCLAVKAKYPKTS
tara:strand:- start:447 stop:818 length:372 start_codon:yes stop_codon:yes gene_type:complete